VRVALADDSALFRRGLALLLEAAGLEVVAAVPTGVELARAVATTPVDAVVLDIRMPPTFTDEGLVTAEALRTAEPGLGVLVLSTYVEAAYAVRLLARGGTGTGYLLKDRVDDVGTVVDALHRTARGESVVDPEVVARLVDRPPRDPLAELSGRERDVLRLLAQGRSNAAIAAALFLSDKTVEGHVARTFAKLGLLPQDDTNRRVLAVLRYLQAQPQA
jgi:DNA-binding NarL/FixJ family response regulator